MPPPLTSGVVVEDVRADQGQLADVLDAGAAAAAGVAAGDDQVGHPHHGHRIDHDHPAGAAAVQHGLVGLVRVAEEVKALVHHERADALPADVQPVPRVGPGDRAGEREPGDGRERGALGGVLHPAGRRCGARRGARHHPGRGQPGRRNEHSGQSSYACSPHREHPPSTSVRTWPCRPRRHTPCPDCARPAAPPAEPVGPRARQPFGSGRSGNPVGAFAASAARARCSRTRRPSQAPPASAA